MKPVFILLLLIVSSSCADRMMQIKQSKRNAEFEQINFNDLTKIYMTKRIEAPDDVEGIYSVSSLILKKGKGLLSATEREKVLDQRENYSKVAIIRDQGNTDREYFEVPIDKERLPSYSVRGEFARVSEGSILVYKHFEPKGKILSYTFTYDNDKDILEGVRTEVNGNFTITFKLTYLKLFPKTDN